MIQTNANLQNNIYNFDKFNNYVIIIRLLKNYFYLYYEICFACVFNFLKK